MKNINEFINKNVSINEALAKDVHKPRKGSELYVMPTNSNKAYRIKVEDVLVRPMYATRSGNRYKYNDSKDSKVFNIVFAENELGIDGYTSYHFSSIDYEPIFCELVGDCYIGVSKEAIKEYINSQSKPKLEDIVKKIAKLENELIELQKEKSELENRINSEITESLIDESREKYAIEYSISGSKNTIFTNYIGKALNDIKSKGYDPKRDYYIVFDNSKSNFSEIDSVIKFGGTGSYFHNLMNSNELRPSIYDKLQAKMEN